MVKVHILFDFKDSPWGGGNQFLKILRNYFDDNGLYHHNPLESNAILVNSKDNLERAASIKGNDKICVHRIDGIFSIYRGEHERYNDLKVYEFSRKHSDGTIFQSEWSRKESKKNGMSDNKKEIVIRNCSDPKMFNTDRTYNINRKVRLITSCWSDNPKKGVATYKYLDENLDFDRYEYVFVGRSPVTFKNIKMLGILSSVDLSRELKRSDVFVTAAEVDACSNSLVEALSCGLPSVVLNSGGSPEIMGNGGELFDSTKDVIEKIEMISSQINFYRSKISVARIDDVGKRYYDFISDIYNEKKA